ncbi:MAG TPA: VanZ family protein [Nitrospiria bacterium]
MIKDPGRFQPPAARQFVWYWLPVILYALLILFISSLPVRIRHVPFHHYDKVFHFIEYGIYAGLWYRAIRRTTHLSTPARAGIATFLICASFGALDELYQVYTPYRVSDIYDVAADASGSLTAVFLPVLKNFLARP